MEKIIMRNTLLRRGLEKAYVLEREGNIIQSVEVLLKDMPNKVVEQASKSEEEEWAEHTLACVGCAKCDNPGY